MLLQPSIPVARSRPFAAPVSHSWSGRQPWRRSGTLNVAAHARDLWEYEATRVQELNCETLKFMHSMSYGHRNRKTVMVIVYDPEEPSCQAVEFEVERLASGLSHEPSVLVAKFNVGKSHGRQPAPEATFAAGTLGVNQLPTVLMYPVGTPGVMRYQGSHITAEALLSSINRIHHTITPQRSDLVLLGVPDSHQQAGEGFVQAGASSAADQAGAGIGAGDAQSAQAAAAAAGKPGKKGRGEGRRKGQADLSGSQGMHQIPAGEATGVAGNPAAVSSTDAAQHVTSATAGNVGPAAATEAVAPAPRSAGSSRGSSTSQVVSEGVSPTEWLGGRAPYWTPGKALLWGGIAFLSVASVVWERWLGPRLEAKRLLARQAERQAGRGDQFDEDTNLRDLFVLRQLEVQAVRARGAEPLAGIGRFTGVRPSQRLNGRLGQVDGQLGQVDGQLGQLDGQLGQLDVRVDDEGGLGYAESDFGPGSRSDQGFGSDRMADQGLGPAAGKPGVSVASGVQQGRIAPGPVQGATGLGFGGARVSDGGEGPTVDEVAEMLRAVRGGGLMSERMCEDEANGAGDQGEMEVVEAQDWQSGSPQGDEDGAVGGVRAAGSNGQQRMT